MSETLSECDVHPCEDVNFKRSVVRAIIGKQACGIIAVSVTKQTTSESLRIHAALGSDPAYSLLINECADRIASDQCDRFTLTNVGNVFIVDSRANSP